MGYFNTKQGVLFYCYTIDVEQKRKIDSFLELLDKSGVDELIKLETANLESNRDMGRPGYDPYKVFACVLYGFAMGSRSLRDLESSCSNDVRYMYLMEGQKPSYAYFCNYINAVIKPHIEQIFTMVTSRIFRSFGLEIDDCFIDGTKQKAFPNKYKVVWKPTAFHRRLADKTRSSGKLLAIPRKRKLLIIQV